MSAAPLMPVYSPAPADFVQGRGVDVFTAEGKRYLDFIAGIATNCLGHCHPKLVAAITAQANKIWHMSNMYQTELQRSLAEKYTKATFADVVFFANSGTEAIEACLKLTRKYHSANGHPEKIDILSFEGAFHGRSYGAINAAANPTYLAGFGPPLPGYLQLPFGDHEALKAAITPTTAAIMIEPVQGEGGVRAVPTDCLQGLRALCDEHGLLLIFDEVQSGAGRTGKLFAHEWAGITPDVMAVAKGMGGGFPMGACLATAHASSGMVKGVHGSTFGGNPLAMAVGHAVFDEITQPQFLEHVRDVANHLHQGLAGLKDRYPDLVVDVRGKGLLAGIKLTMDPLKVRQLCFEHGMLVGTAGQNVLRLAPPLIVSTEHVSEAISILDAALAAAREQQKAAA
ncbi:acetylornithine aminotransferase [Candidatus Phycosocius spiralis]|uniref:Acetylornithine aminotransferase n=2 Tax=Candidatus Phycosocius spiralis TaxID=2815099 RepID=A0ABQ4PVS6_9PROT|nr:acetylornithine aminotransferase [Candidatus Phycosocius spiralis]